MNQRPFEKENNLTPAFQLRTKNYSPLPSTSYHQPTPPKSKQSNREQPHNYLPTFENNREEQPIFHFPLPRQRVLDDSITPGRHESVTSYAKSRYELTSKNQFEDKGQRRNNASTFSKEQDTFLDHSFGESSMQNDIVPHRREVRENAKKRGLQIKMSNIESINDKINNLLSMVKKDKVERLSLENSVQYSPKRMESPQAARANAVSHYQASQSKEAKKSTVKAELYQDIDRSHKRVKTHSAAQTQKKDRQEHRIRVYNEEDQRLYKQAYIPSQQIYSPSKKLIPKENFPQRVYEKSKYPSQRTEHKYSPVKEQQKTAFQEITNRKASFALQEPKKYEPIDFQFNHTPERIKLQEKRQKTPARRNGDSLIPITLLSNDTRQKMNSGQSSSGINMIDNQIRKIKEKINQSQSQNKRYQERLQEGRQQRSPTNAGKIYCKDTASSNKKFQIKLHPVINDKPETVKIAEKLCYQIEIDNRMRKPRQAFEKVQGQQKWEELQSKLNRQGIRLTIFQIKELISLSPDEFSPFDSEVAANIDVLKHFCDSQKFWENQLCGCASQKVLRHQGFNISELDLNKKGYLSIEDLVCFVNLYSGHFYKNRDLTIIFRRLQLLQKSKKASEIEFSTFFRAFTI